jgi:hypothetical protein
MPTDSNFSGFDAMPMCNCGRCKRCYMQNQFVGNKEFLNVTGEPVSSTIIVAWIGLASAVTAALGTILGKAIDSKSKKREIEAATKLAEQEQTNLTKAQEQEIALKEKDLLMQGDPTNLILTNPNLTDEQRAIALKQLDEAESEGTQRKVIKYAIYGGMALIVLYLGSKMLKKSSINK